MAAKYNFDKKILCAQLKELSEVQQFLFALLCCERLYPNYKAFARHHDWGDPRVLRNSLDLAWSMLRGDVEPVDLSDPTESLELLTPDTEDFSSVYVSPALDAAVATRLLISLCSGPSISKVVEIASLCRDTVDMYVQEVENLGPDDPRREEKILEHHLMQEELARQCNDIELVRSIRIFDRAAVDKIAVQRQDQGKSNICL